MEFAKFPSRKAESKDLLNMEMVRTINFDFVKIKESKVGAGPLSPREEKKD